MDYIFHRDHGSMTKIPDGLKYTKTHEWYMIEGDKLTMGISDYAQNQLTDIVYIDLPSKGTRKKVGEALLTIESVKSAEDVYSPADGEVTDVNSALTDSPEAVNKDCYSNWMVKMKVTGKLADSMDAAQYRKFIGE